MECGYRKCNNLFTNKPLKIYCSMKCKDSEMYYRKSDRIENKDTKYKWKDLNILPGSVFPEFRSDRIIINISYRNVTHYLKLGYNAIINNNLEIKIVDLPSSSHTKVDVVCQRCGIVNNLRFHKYISNKERGGIYTCRKCRSSKIKELSIIEKSEERYKDISNSSYLKYKNEVRRLSKSSMKVLYENWDGYDYYDGEYIKDYMSLSHLHDNYPSVDHKISVYHGFDNNLPPEEISDISNLCITKRFINSKKRDIIESEFNLG